MSLERSSACAFDTGLLILGCACADDDGFRTSCGPLRSGLGTSPAKALHVMSELNVSPKSTRRIMRTLSWFCPSSVNSDLGQEYEGNGEPLIVSIETVASLTFSDQGHLTLVRVEGPGKSRTVHQVDAISSGMCASCLFHRMITPEWVRRLAGEYGASKRLHRPTRPSK